MEKFKIAHINGFRNENELVIYIDSEKTGTNCYGLEACIKNDRVIHFGGNNNDIPENGYVISGHGKAAGFLMQNACEGARVIYDKNDNTVQFIIDDEAKELKLHNKEQEVKSRIGLLIKNGQSYDCEKVDSILKQFHKQKESKDFAAAQNSIEEAYYLTSQTKKDETRAVWHRPHEKSYDEVDAMVKKFHDAGFNLILLETNYEGYATTSKLSHDYLPLSPRYDASFDIIDAFIVAGKKYDVKMHCWFEDFFYGVESTGCPLASIYPEYMAKRKDGGLLHDAYDTFYFLNPVLDEVQNLLLAEIREILDKYDFDGLQLDYIRYPVMHGIDYCAGFDKYTVERFNDETGISINSITDENSQEWKAFTKWRTAYISKYVKSVRDIIDEYKNKGRNIQLSTAVFGIPDEAIRLKCQDWCSWIENNWLDAIYPMAYLDDANDIEREIEYMVRQYGNVPNISGLAPMYNHLPIIETTKQVEACRRAGAKGVAFFAAYNFSEEQLEKLKIGVFR